MTPGNSKQICFRINEMTAEKIQQAVTEKVWNSARSAANL